MSTQKNTVKNGADRDSGGRFAPGCKGGPGRPKGSANSLLIQARQWVEEKGLPLMIAAAEGGDMDAARLLVTLAMPKVKPVAPPLECLKDMPVPERGKDMAAVAVFLLNKLRDGQIAVPDAFAVYELAEKAMQAQSSARSRLIDLDEI